MSYKFLAISILTLAFFSVSCSHSDWRYDGEHSSKHYGHKDKKHHKEHAKHRSADMGLRGIPFVVTNTFQSPDTKNKEMDAAAFGLSESSSFARVSRDVEIPRFIDLYDIDVSSNTIKFTEIDTDFSKKVAGPMKKNSYDRNYFTFRLPKGIAITAIEFNEDASDLLPGSAKPSAQVLSRNRIVTVNGAGVIHGVGYNPVFTVTLKEQEAGKEKTKQH